MDAQVKREERADKDKSQSKAFPPSGAKDTYARSPKINASARAMYGRPCLSTRVKILGAIPLRAKAWMVRVDP